MHWFFCIVHEAYFALCLDTLKFGTWIGAAVDGTNRSPFFVLAPLPRRCIVVQPAA